MKPQQPLNESTFQIVLESMNAHLHCAKTGLPTFTAFAVAIASSVVLTLGG